MYCKLDLELTTIMSPIRVNKCIKYIKHAKQRKSQGSILTRTWNTSNTSTTIPTNLIPDILKEDSLKSNETSIQL